MKFIETLKNVWKIEELRNRILLTLSLLLVYRFGAQVVLPGIDASRLADFAGNLIKSNEGVLKWINNNEIFNLNLWEGDKIYLDWLKQNKLFSAKFIYKKGSLKDYSVIFY